MQMIDFEYNGERLSDFGLVICNFDGNSNDSQDIGNSISLNKFKATNADEYFATGYAYEDVFSVEFQAVKIGCSVVDQYITDIEMNKIMRWLNRKTYCVFKPIYADDNFMDIYYKGTFNVKPIKVGIDIVGLNLTFTTNAPFGFMSPTVSNFEFKTINDKFIIHDISDEVGHIYADVKIKCLEAGDLIISNELDPNNKMIIRNCAIGETIELQGKQKIIQSSGHARLANDFNYNFIRIKNTYNDVMNVFTSSIKCNMTITYSPIRKVGLIL